MSVGAGMRSALAFVAGACAGGLATIGWVILEDLRRDRSR